jgi:hypothetical protein
VVTCRDTRRGITVRFDGGQVRTSGLVAQAGWLVSVVGSYASTSSNATGGFGLVCLAEDGASAIVPGFLRGALEYDPGEIALCSHEGLEHSFKVAGGDFQRTCLALVAMDPHGTTTTLASGGASAERAMMQTQTSIEQSQGWPFTLRLGAGSDPLDRGILIEFQQQVVSTSACPRLAEKRGPRQRRWKLTRLLSRLGYPRRRRERS